MLTTGLQVRMEILWGAEEMNSGVKSGSAHEYNHFPRTPQ